jgi:hypothetical protein
MVIPISLGLLSNSRIHIKNHYNLSKENGYKTCPFDLMISNYKGIIDCFKDNFEGFCETKYIELRNIYGTNEKWIYNTKYKFLFNHESPGHSTDNTSLANLNHYIDNNYEHFIIRYRNRINNLINYLNSGNHIIFVITRHNNNISDLSELNDVIKNKYPNLSFEFDLLQDYNKEGVLYNNLTMGINDDDAYSEYPRIHPYVQIESYWDYDYKIFRVFEDEITEDQYKLKELFLYKVTQKIDIVYSLKSFYKTYNNFNYFLFRKSHYNELHNFTEVETIIYWYNNYYKLHKPETINQVDLELVKNKKNIVVHMPHLFNPGIGGIVVTYELANILDKFGERVRIYTSYSNKKNPLFNNIYLDDFDTNDCVVIYTELFQSNPLNIPRVVRWILAPLKALDSTWKNNDLVYYFNSELRFENKIGDYKMLTDLYISPMFKKYNMNDRSGTCFHYRKKYLYKTITKLHNDSDYELHGGHSLEHFVDVFNRHQFLVLYDPLCFYAMMAPFCGCVSIVHPIEGLTKFEWMTKYIMGLSNYFIDKNVNNVYGIAYGIEDIEYAKSTIHLAYEQMQDIKKYLVDKTVIPFINDMNNFELMTNTVEKNYY